LIYYIEELTPLYFPNSATHMLA